MDLIDRQEALQAKPEYLNSSVKRITEKQTLADRSYARGWNACTERWLKEIASLPSVQPEIILCKDCAWGMTGNFSKKFFCSLTGALVWIEPNSFCSYAERKTDGSD